jgi:hypothetical protein
MYAALLDLINLDAAAYPQFHPEPCLHARTLAVFHNDPTKLY